MTVQTNLISLSLEPEQDRKATFYPSVMCLIDYLRSLFPSFSPVAVCITQPSLLGSREMQCSVGALMLLLVSYCSLLISGAIQQNPHMLKGSQLNSLLRSEDKLKSPIVCLSWYYHVTALYIFTC